MKIIIGLGNPGGKYHKTRHNVGFLAVDSLREQLDFEEWKDSKFSAIISEGFYKNEKIILIKPLTFMNLSGNSVQSLCHFYKISEKDICVISDDIDIEFEKVRFREKGSHGGQNGIRDIITKLGTQEFARVKIGVGRHPKIEVTDWVLSQFSTDEQKILAEKIFDEVQEKIEKWLNNSLCD